VNDAAATTDTPGSVQEPGVSSSVPDPAVLGAGWTRRSPLPPRGGLAAARYRLPAQVAEATVRDHLVALLAHRVPAGRIDGMFAQQRYVDADGRPVGPTDPARPGLVLWFHRDLPVESTEPFEVPVLFRDERIVVVDKPHRLATIPRGQHVRRTALVHLREELGLPELAPAHRLDFATAGVLMLTTQRRWRGAYQELFRHRLVDKTYLAVAPVRPELELPTTVRSSIEKRRGELQAVQVPGGPVNAVTEVVLSGVGVVGSAGGGGALGGYRLHPSTGRTHQLRVHLHALGIPIVGDRLYPTVLPDDPGGEPLQLLAATLSFPDPVDGRPRSFRTRRRLERWPPGVDPGGWSSAR
jgi:tRNA pseudouridine32 synthase/23S rRNA pseudouridine746 synthase